MVTWIKSIADLFSFHNKPHCKRLLEENPSDLFQRLFFCLLKVNKMEGRINWLSSNAYHCVKVLVLFAEKFYTPNFVVRALQTLLPSDWKYWCLLPRKALFYASQTKVFLASWQIVLNCCMNLNILNTNCHSRVPETSKDTIFSICHENLCLVFALLDAG